MKPLPTIDAHAHIDPTRAKGEPQQLRLRVKDIRRLAWENIGSNFYETDTTRLLPEPLARIIREVKHPR